MVRWAGAIVVDFCHFFLLLNLFFVGHLKVQPILHTRNEKSPGRLGAVCWGYYLYPVMWGLY